MADNMMEGVQAAATGQEESLPPKLKKELVAYRTVLNKILHSKETRNEVMGMIEAGDPELVVPPSALEVDKMASRMTKGKVSMEARLAGGVYIVSELLELGQAAKLWEPVTEELAQVVFQDTLQDYIEQGLKDGTVDPVALQQSAEPLMNPEQQAAGLKAGNEFGIPAQGSPHAAVRNAQDVKKRQVETQGALKAAEAQGGK